MEVIVLIAYRAQPGKDERAARELASLVRTVTATENDCLGITMLRGVEDPARILLHERWTSREAYVGPHMETPHLKAFIARASEWFGGPPEITFWHEVREG